MHRKYKRMIGVMLEKEESVKKKKVKKKKDPARAYEVWFLYILRCKDGSLYTGITKNLERRFETHNKGKASKYTRARRPLKLVYKEICGSHAEALVRECRVKELPKDKKENMAANYLTISP